MSCWFLQRRRESGAGETFFSDLQSELVTNAFFSSVVHDALPPSAHIVPYSSSVWQMAAVPRRRSHQQSGLSCWEVEFQLIDHSLISLLSSTGCPKQPLLLGISLRTSRVLEVFFVYCKNKTNVTVSQIPLKVHASNDI